MHDPQRPRTDHHGRHVAVKARLIGKGIATHVVEPLLGLTELKKMGPDPLLILSTIDETYFESDPDVPAKFEVRRRCRAGFLCPQIFLGGVSLANNIIPTCDGLIDQVGLKARIGEIKGDSVERICNRLTQLAAKLR